MTSLGASALVLGVRYVGWLQPLELRAFDQLMRLRPAEGPDPRLLLVTVNEADINKYNWPLSDETLSQLLIRLESYKPNAIGMDIYRNLPVRTGYGALAGTFKGQSNIITICQLSDAKNSQGIPPPPAIPAERVGFSDISPDEDGIVRRSILYGNAQGKCKASASLATLLAVHYLQKQGIDDFKPASQNDLQLGKTVFHIMDNSAGSYQHLDAAGYQVLLNYRATTQIARQVSVTQVLNGQLDPKWVKDRIVLIGTTADSVKDNYYTPYSTLSQNPVMRGVVVHAHEVSQIISAVQDGRPLIWYWPDWLEVLWVWGWSVVGGCIGWRLQHPLQLATAESAAVGGLIVICYGVFLLGGWIPVLPPALALVIASVSGVTYTAYQTQQEQEKIVKQVREQDESIALLTTLLKQDDGTQDEQTLVFSKISTSEARATHFLLVGRYKIIKAIGLGGFGQTYLAEDTQRPGSPTCVVKQLRPARQDATFLQVSRRLFHTEAEILEVLGRHSQIPHLLAYFEDNQQFYLVQEYIDGHSLSAELPVDQRQSESFVVALLKGVLEILIFIHDHHVLHRDVKPSNIIRRQQDGRLVLIDFGAVKQMQPSLQEGPEGPTVAIGTRGYAPPEQLTGHPQFSSDIYALGMIGIQAVTGIPPHMLKPNKNSGTVDWRHLAKVSEEFASILDKMVRYHFNERYQSAAAVLQDLKQLAH